MGGEARWVHDELFAQVGPFRNKYGDDRATVSIVKMRNLRTCELNGNRPQRERQALEFTINLMLYTDTNRPGSEP